MVTQRLATFLFLVALLPWSASCSGEAETNPWVGQTYLLEIPSTRWSEPPELGTEIGEFVPQFVLDVQSSSGTTLDVMVGTAKDGQQQMCNPTAHLEGTSAAPPEVQIGPGEFPIYLRNEDHDITVNATVHDLTITNVLPDGETLAEEGELQAVMDVRELYPMFVLLMSPTPDRVCTAMEDVVGGCEPCPHDGETYCLTIKATYLGATQLTDFALEPVDASSVDASCQDTPTE